MAFSIEQYPVNSADNVPVITNWTPMIGYVLYQDDISSYFFYRLVCTIEQVDSAGVVLKSLGVLKQRRNGYSPDVVNQRARAFFDLSGIINSQLVDTVYDQNDSGIPFRTLHKLGANKNDKIFSYNGDTSQGFLQIISIKMTGSEWYSDSATGIPSSQGATANDTQIWMGASLPLMTERDDDGDYIQGTAFQSYRSSGLFEKMLSDVPAQPNIYYDSIINILVNFVREDDYHTVGFLNDNTNFGSNVDYIKITYYLYDGTNDSVYIENNTTNGGMASTDGDLEDTNRLLYFGCGPGNLEGASNVDSYESIGGVATTGGAQPSNFSGWTSYKIQPYTDGDAPISLPYYFIRKGDSCKGFKIRRLAFVNSLGCWDYFNFTKKSTQTIDITRNNYSSVLGTFNKSTWRYDNTQRGKTTRRTSAILKETLQTDWIAEELSPFIEKLIYSKNVQIVENKDTEFTEGVIVTDSSFVRKTKANDKLIQYTINIEYANPINTNS